MQCLFFTFRLGSFITPTRVAQLLTIRVTIHAATNRNQAAQININNAFAAITCPSDINITCATQDGVAKFSFQMATYDDIHFSDLAKNRCIYSQDF
jgi:hypothetical protein